MNFTFPFRAFSPPRPSRPIGPDSAPRALPGAAAPPAPRGPRALRAFAGDEALVWPREVTALSYVFYYVIPSHLTSTSRDSPL